jgi:hypothetical protein
MNDRLGSNLPIPGRGREGPESALCGRWVTTRRMGEDAPKQTVSAARGE